jgi:hypothetical protein
MPDLHTAHVGRFSGSEQFFVAHHLVPPVSDDAQGHEYVALYCFDKAGLLKSHKIVRPTRLRVEEAVSSFLAEVAPHHFTDICVSPFQVTFDGRTFGLIPDSRLQAITLEPGSMITFTEPWDGEYYT